MLEHEAKKKQVAQDIAIITASIVAAIFIVKSGIVDDVVTSFGDAQAVGAFFAGILFTSIFTVAPAVAVLGELAQSNSPLFVALWGAIGAVVGDYIIFSLVRDRFAEDIKFLLGYTNIKRFFAIPGTKMFPWLVPLTGAVIIASPFPDEVGLAMLGLSKMKEQTFIGLTFVLNGGGIFAIGWAAQALGW